jgi:hypothetical protein
LAVPDRIERPQDLGLPPEAVEVFSHLTEHGASIFSQEIVQALMKAQRRGNLRPVRDVVEAWYRTLILRQDPSYEENVDWAKRSRPKKGRTLEGFKATLGV